MQGCGRMAKRRLDSLLAERGLFSSRSRAAASIMAGDVLLGAGERRARKPGELVEEDERLRVRERRPFVSRGGEKLANALESTGLDVRGRRAVDVGASTGGFGDCLLQHGAERVIALDVGYGLLAWSLRENPRVVVLERTNARALTPAMLAYVPDLAVIDVSFISLRKVLGAVLACMAARYDVLALVKPQFELERGRVGKGGVVRDAQAGHPAGRGNRARRFPGRARRPVHRPRRRRDDPARAAALRRHRRPRVRDQLRRDRLPRDDRAERDRRGRAPRTRQRLRAA